MKNMIPFELYKTLHKPLYLLLFLVCLGLHFGMLLYQEHASWGDEGDTYSFCDQAEYDAYRSGILQQARQRLSSPLFAHMDAYTYDSLHHTKAVYEQLGKIEVTPDFDGGVLLLTQNRLTDILCLLLLTVFVLRQFAEERESGTWLLLKAMKHGHGALIGVKLTTTAILTAGLVLVFYGGGAWQIGQTTGFGDLSRSLQSVTGYMPCVLPVNVGEFLILFISIKFLALFSIGILLALICMVTKGTISALVVFTSAAVVEFILWQTIAINSWIAPMKELNLAALLSAEHYFCEFYHINLFTLAVDQQICGLVLAGACLIGGVALLLFLHEKEMFLALSRVKGVRKSQLFLGRAWRRERVPRCGIFAAAGQCVSARRRGRVIFCEAYKLLFIGKGWLVLIAFAFSCAMLHSSVRYYMDETEYYYREYSMVLEGELSEEKEHFLEQEKERLGQLASEEDVAGRKDALEQATRQYQAIVERKSQGVDAEYVYLTPWQYLLGSGLTFWDTLKLGLCFFCMILFTASCGAMEKQKEMYQLLVLTAVGRKGILARKMLLVLGTALGISLAVFVPGIVQIERSFGISGGKIPAISYGEIPFWGQHLTLAGLAGIKFTMLTVLILAAAGVLLMISEKMKSRILTILTGILIFLVPLVIFQVML